MHRPAAKLNMDILLADKLRSESLVNKSFSTYQPMYLGFENAMRTMQDRISEAIESSLQFLLPFTVETDIHEIAPFVKSTSGCHILRATL